MTIEPDLKDWTWVLERACHVRDVHLRFEERARLARTGRRTNGSVFTVATLGGYHPHDVVHPLYDVGST